MDEQAARADLIERFGPVLEEDADLLTECAPFPPRAARRAYRARRAQA
jgi:hypothetical protein